MSEPQPLPLLYANALSSASRAAKLSVLDDQTQVLVSSALQALKILDVRIHALSLFSSNETVEDISTRDLLYLLVPYVRSELQGRVRATERDERLASLRQAQVFLRSFLESLDSYDVIPEDERQLHSQGTSTVADPAKRRALKIKQYQKEKDLRGRIETIRKRRGQQSTADDTPSDFDLISSLLPSPENATTDEEEDDSSTDDILREASLLLIRLMYAQAHAHLVSMEQELELLRHAPSPSMEPSRPVNDSRDRRQEADDMWKLDLPAGRGSDGQGPLMDPSGKPLRPFTILPAGATDRARLQAQVFGPGHRLPTMSVDEYLNIERERGNIITGGGPASAEAPTSSEQLAMDAEQDGTIMGDEKTEEKRQKDEKWARYTDENPRGAGNTMNRG